MTGVQKERMYGMMVARAHIGNGIRVNHTLGILTMMRYYKTIMEDGGLIVIIILGIAPYVKKKVSVR